MDLLLPCLFTIYNITPEHLYIYIYTQYTIFETSKISQIYDSIIHFLAYECKLFLYISVVSDKDWPHRWISQELQLSMLRYYRALATDWWMVVVVGNLVARQKETYWKNRYNWLFVAKIFGCNRTGNDRKHDIIGYFKKVSLPTVVLLWYIVWARYMF